MLETIRVRLEPTKEQENMFHSFIGASKFAYNYVIRKQQENHETGNKFIPYFEFKKLFTQVKQEFPFLMECASETLVGALGDAFDAYDRFFKGLSGYPNYRSRHKKGFYSRYDKIKFGINLDVVKDKRIIKSALKGKFKEYDLSKRVYLEKIGWVKLRESERFLGYTEFKNPRIKFDGLHWYLTVGVEVKREEIKLTDVVLAGDVGIKDMVTLSNGKKHKNINKFKEMKRLEKKKKRLQRESSRLYQAQREKGTAVKKGEKFKKSKNQVKIEREIKKVSNKMSNIRQTYIQQTVSSMVKTLPKAIVLEDLNITGMLKNGKLSKAIQDSCWGYFSRWVEWESVQYGITYIEADRFYASSKLCSSCGHKHKDLKLTDRIFKCPNCGLVIDRDYNAALNLEEYGKKYLLLSA